MAIHYFVDLSQLARRTGCLHALLIIPNLLGGTFVNGSHLLPIYILGGGGWREIQKYKTTFELMH